MIESPLIRELVAESKQDAILRFLQARFGPVPEDLAASIRAIPAERRLDELIDRAGRCRTLATFQVGT